MERNKHDDFIAAVTREERAVVRRRPASSVLFSLDSIAAARYRSANNGRLAAREKRQLAA